MAVLEALATPDIEKRLGKLVEEHRKIKDEPLQLAVHYVPQRAAGHIYLLEIADRFGIDSVDRERKMFEVAYGPTGGFPMEPSQELRLLLTNPTEWKTALQQNWPAIRRLRLAQKNERADVLFATPRGMKLWRLLRA